MTEPGNESADYPGRSDVPRGSSRPPASDQSPTPDRPTMASQSGGPAQFVPAPESPGETERTKPAPGFTESGHVKNTRTSGVWIGLIATALFLILLIDFIAQNSRKVSIHFFGWHGQFSLALTILLSAVIGVVLVAIPGTVRILQLRRALRKNGPGRR